MCLLIKLLVLIGFFYPGNYCKAFENPRISPNISVLPTQRSLLGEGPFYDGANQLLYYVDSFNGDFIRLDLVSLTETKIHVGGTVTIIIPIQSSIGNEFLFTKDSQLLKLNWETQVTELLATVSSPVGNENFNDGKCDAAGRLIIGTVTKNALGGIIANASSIYRLENTNSNYTLVRLADGISVSNGMSWSNNTYYVNDFGKKIIYAFDYDVETGTLFNQRILIDCANHPDFVANEYPDGMAIDAFGYIWVAMYSGGRIVRINPYTASVVDEVRFPRANSPTSLAFGKYQGEDGFFVTTGYNLLDGGKIHFVGFTGADIKPYNPSS